MPDEQQKIMPPPPEENFPNVGTGEFKNAYQDTYDLEPGTKVTQVRVGPDGIYLDDDTFISYGDLITSLQHNLTPEQPVGAAIIGGFINAVNDYRRNHENDKTEDKTLLTQPEEKEESNKFDY